MDKRIPLESVIQKNIHLRLRIDYSKGVWYKIHGSLHQERGIPDIIGCFDGRFIAFEVKRPGESYRTPTPYQQRQIDLIRKAGGVVAVVVEYEQVKKILENLSKKL